jgi:hypothetical protein
MASERPTRAYRKRRNPTKAEKAILEYYAERYTIARAIGTPRGETKQIVEEAREALEAISTRAWNVRGQETYEIRQWFNRWNESRVRRGVALGERPEGRYTEEEESERIASESMRIRSEEVAGKGDELYSVASDPLFPTSEMLDVSTYGPAGWFSIVEGRVDERFEQL